MKVLSMDTSFCATMWSDVDDDTGFIHGRGGNLGAPEGFTTIPCIFLLKKAGLGGSSLYTNYGQCV